MAEDLQIKVLPSDPVNPARVARARRTRKPTESEVSAAATEADKAPSVPENSEPEASEPETSDPFPAIIEVPDRKEAPSKAKAGSPSLAEWQDFIGRFVIRGLTEGYVFLMLGDLELTEKERKLITLTKDDFDEMAAPLASTANKMSWTRKHGRAIVSAADSYEAVIALFVWMRRVRRIAKRRAPKTPRTIQGEGFNVDSGQDVGPGPDFGGQVNGYRIYNPGSG